MVEVSVVIPTRNRAHLLSSSLAGALAQRDVDVEVVVVDDGSTDKTAAMLAAFDDARIRVVHTAVPGSGPGVARNTGIAKSRADWIAFLDDDDLWAPDKLRAQLRAVTAAERRWVYAGWVTVEERGQRLEVIAARPPMSPEQVRELLPYRNVIGAGPSNVMVRRDLLDEVGPFDESLPHMEDWDMWIRLAAAEVPVLVPEPLTAYRLHMRHRSMDLDGTMDARRTIEARYRSLRGGRPLDWAAAYRYLGWLAWRRGQRRTAFRAYLLSARNGDLKSLARGAVALIAPSAGRAGYRRNVDPRRKAQAMQWLRWYTAAETLRRSRASSRG